MLKKFIIFLLLASSSSANELDFVPKFSLMRGQFEQIKKIDGSSKNFSSNGKFIFSEELGLFWETSQPFSSVLVFTKNGLLKIEDGKKEIVVTKDQGFFSEFSEIFQAVFSGNFDKIKHNFDITYKNSDSGWSLILVANNQVVKEVIKEISISGKNFVNKIEMIDSSNDKTVIKLKNFSQKLLTQHEKNHFKF